MKLFRKQLLKAAKILVLCLIFFGGMYPAALWGIPHLFWPQKASGSFETTSAGRLSLLAGQPFDKDENLWGRQQKGQIIENADGTYSLLAMPADNDISSEDYLREIETRKEEIQKRNPQAVGEVPEELYTWSASGMDPDVSLEAALYQVPRIAKARNLEPEIVDSLIRSLATHPLPGSATGPTVSTIQVNLALKELKS